MLEQILKMLNAEEELYSQPPRKTSPSPKKKKPDELSASQAAQVKKQPDIAAAKPVKPESASLLGSKITSNDLVKGIIFSEILGRPVSMRRGR